MTPFDWYSRAKEKIDGFLPDLDELLEVDVDETGVSPLDGSADYETFALSFSHPSNPNLQWTMEVELNDEFIEQKLEDIVKKIYFERVE